MQQVGHEARAQLLAQGGGHVGGQLGEHEGKLGGQMRGVVPGLVELNLPPKSALEILFHLEGGGAAALAAEDAVEQGLGQLVLHGGVIALAGEEVLIDEPHQAALVVLGQRLLVLLPPLPLLDVGGARDLVQQPGIHVAIEAVARLFGADGDQHGPALLERLDGPFRRLQQGQRPGRVAPGELLQSQAHHADDVVGGLLQQVHLVLVVVLVGEFQAHQHRLALDGGKLLVAQAFVVAAKTQYLGEEGAFVGLADD
ncbi:hypothetical protein D3C77_307520 [compost metagenome]